MAHGDLGKKKVGRLVSEMFVDILPCTERTMCVCWVIYHRSGNTFIIPGVFQGVFLWSAPTVKHTWGHRHCDRHRSPQLRLMLFVLIQQFYEEWHRLYLCELQAERHDGEIRNSSNVLTPQTIHLSNGEEVRLLF